MFGIEWLRNGMLVDKDSTVLADKAAAVADAWSRATAVAARYPERRPDSFAHPHVNRPAKEGLRESPPAAQTKPYISSRCLKRGPLTAVQHHYPLLA
jgi:hypothetical protein